MGATKRLLCRQLSCTCIRFTGESSPTRSTHEFLLVESSVSWRSRVSRWSISNVGTCNCEHWNTNVHAVENYVLRISEKLHTSCETRLDTVLHNIVTIKIKLYVLWLVPKKIPKCPVQRAVTHTIKCADVRHFRIQRVPRRPVRFGSSLDFRFMWNHNSQKPSRSEFHEQTRNCIFFVFIFFRTARFNAYAIGNGMPRPI